MLFGDSIFYGSILRNVIYQRMGDRALAMLICCALFFIKSGAEINTGGFGFSCVNIDFEN